MAAVVADAAPLLKRAGFRKRRHSFNRETEPGIVQVVNFQLGRNLYRRFTINLGVYVPEMVLDEHERRDGWVNEYDCQLRQRIGRLLDQPTDVWWSLDDPAEAASAVAHALESSGLPWLDRVSSRQKILESYELFGAASVGLMPRGAVQIAWLVKESDRARAEAILRDYLQEALRHPDYWALLTQWLKAGGFEDLLDEAPDGSNAGTSL
jgi:hypothetical protein